MLDEERKGGAWRFGVMYVTTSSWNTRGGAALQHMLGSMSVVVGCDIRNTGANISQFIGVFSSLRPSERRGTGMHCHTRPGCQ